MAVIDEKTEVKIDQVNQESEEKAASIETNSADVATAQGDGVTQEEEKSPEPEATALEKFWKAVRENPSDFTGWTYLLQYVEQQNEAEPAREAFDAFLARYPYCYGYWKKYADMEARNENLKEAEMVFEKGLMAIPLSIDLWVHYINFSIKRSTDDPDRYNLIKSLYERALTAAGTDFRGDKLWDNYIAWETEQNNLVNVTQLYDRVLKIPSHLYSQHFEKFQKHIESNIPKDILTLDEFLKLRMEVLQKIEDEKKKRMESEEPEAPGDDTAPPGDELPPGADAPPGEFGPPGAGLQSKTDASELKALREKIIEARRSVHKVTEEEVSKRWSYEEGIRRPYFHVKPLEKGQLKNWKEYLDFEIENGTHQRVMILFERCMIACALYEEFWLKYAKYMESHNLDIVRNIFKRACNIHLPKKVTIHLEWSAFEERQGIYDTAEEVLDNLEKLSPGLAMVQCRKIGLQRRQGKFQQAQDMYQQCIEQAEDSTTRSFYAIKYARYLSKVLGNSERAMAVLEAAFDKDQSNHKLLLQMVDVEYGKTTINEGTMVKLFDRCINADIEFDQKILFSQRKLEFLEDFGSTVARLLDAYDEHQKLNKELQASKKKRKEEVPPEEEPSAKKVKTETSAATTTPAANGAGDTSQQQQQAAVAAAQSTAAATSTSTAAAQQYPQQQQDAYNQYYNQGWGGHYGSGWGGYNQWGGYGQGQWGY